MLGDSLGFGHPRVSRSGQDFHPNRVSGSEQVYYSGFGVGPWKLNPAPTRPVAIPIAADCHVLTGELGRDNAGEQCGGGRPAVVCYFAGGLSFGLVLQVGSPQSKILLLIEPRNFQT